MFCPKCGKQIPDGAEFCPECGGSINGQRKVYDAHELRGANSSEKSALIALILCLLGFFCISGIHRFYVGKIGTGILWLLTGGCFGIGTLIDVILIAMKEFKDIDGKVLDNFSAN